MKKIFRIVRNVVLVLLGLILGLICFLLIYYADQEKKLQKQQLVLDQNSQTLLIQADSIAVNIENNALMLLPVPQKIEKTIGFYQIPETLTFQVTDSLQPVVAEFLKFIPGIKSTGVSPDGDMMIIYKNDIPEQGYRLNIQPGKILLEYSSVQGLYYAMITLKVLSTNYNSIIPCLVIEDYPDLAVRGLMLDISRDKVPSVATLKDLITLLADLKFNHIELYVEGFSFAYPSFNYLWEGRETPITGEEIRELDNFCKSHFIDLVPNQNSLGHMMAWLASEEFSNLAECPEGYKLMGLINMKGTLDPTNPESIELVSSMTDDLLPNFSSMKFNVNLDEPFELGKGKSKRLAEKKGVDEVYLEYALKIHNMTTLRNKEMLMWGDIVLRHPGILKKLPRDITLLDWGYEADYPFEKNSKILQSAGVQYMVCPGTSSWTSISGRTNNMLSNIASAASNGVKYGAAGMLLTDWGDMGHWQYMPISYAGYTTGASLSWNSKSMEEFPLVPFLNSYVFRDQRQIMGDLVLDLGRYNQFEELPVPNMTNTMLSLQFGLNDRVMVHAIYKKISSGILELMKEIAPEMITAYSEQFEARRPFDYSGMLSFLDEKEALLDNTELQLKDSLLITDEYRNAIRLIRVGADLQHYIKNRPTLTLQEQKDRLRSLEESLNLYLKENQRLWLARNKPGGFERSTAVLKTLLQQIEKRMTLLDKSFFAREMNRLYEKMHTAATVIYLKTS